MHGDRPRKWRPLKERYKPIPSPVRFMRTSLKPLEPHRLNPINRRGQCPAVTGDAIIVEVSSELQGEEPMLLSDLVRSHIIS